MSENVQSVERALDIINTIVAANGSLSVAELSLAMGLAPSTIHRILQTLTVKNYVFQDPQTKRYDIGPEIVDISSSLYLRYDLVRRVRPYLQTLVELTGETAHVAQLNGATAMYISQVEPLSMVRMFTTPGSVAPLHCSDVGKVFLADLPAARVDEIVRKTGLPARTPRTITDTVRLGEELQQIRLQGFALDDEEREVGVRCLSAGILNGAGKVIAAIGVAGPTSRLTAERVQEISESVTALAQRFATELIRQPAQAEAQRAEIAEQV